MGLIKKKKKRQLINIPSKPLAKRNCHFYSTGRSTVFIEITTCSKVIFKHKNASLKAAHKWSETAIVEVPSSSFQQLISVNVKCSKLNPWMGRGTEEPGRKQPSWNHSFISIFTQQKFLEHVWWISGKVSTKETNYVQLLRF